MVKNPKLATTVAVALAFGVVTVSMWSRHAKTQRSNNRQNRAEVMAPLLTEEAITRALETNNVGVSNLMVRNVGGIVILRGSGDAASAEQAETVIKGLGATRVANLITTRTIDDEELRREAERQLASTNSLAGCTLRVSSENGVLSVTGRVQHELQKDAARSALRAVRGAKSVRVDLAL